MPTRIQNGAGGLISNFYKDAITGKPKTEERVEIQTVTTQSFVALKEIPYKFTRVRISDNSMIEVDNADEISTSKHYYVDYNNYDGKIYFHPLANGLTFSFTYDSIGYIITTSDRIATQWDGTTVIETLQDMMDTMNHAILVSTTYATADDLIKDIEARTLACKNSIDSKITEANNKITDVNTTITSANTARTNLQETIDSGGLNNYQLKLTNPTNEWTSNGTNRPTQVVWFDGHGVDGVPVAGVTATGTENIIKKSKDGLVYLHINFETLDKDGWAKQGRFGNMNGLDICTIPTKFVPQHQIKTYAKIVYYNSTTLKYAKQLCEAWIYPNLDKSEATIILTYTTGTETTDPQAIDLIPANDIYLYYGSIDLCYYANV